LRIIAETGGVAGFPRLIAKIACGNWRRVLGAVWGG
jgi:hypothetical protein